jgi:hypothetical protein
MKILSVALIVLILFAVVSCDRFEHAFAPAFEMDFQTEFFTPLADSFQIVTETNLQPVMDFYDVDYLHNAQYRSDREIWYQTLLEQNPGCTFNVTLEEIRQVSETLARSNWHLTATVQDSVVADSVFIDEELILRDGSWKLYGNREGCGCIQTVTKSVLLEYFTFQTCPNCPVVEELLHNLYLAFPNQMTYLEYHLNDPMALPDNYNVFQYYGLTNMPVTIFQGETVIYGNNEDNEIVFTQLIQNLASQTPKIDLNELQYSLAGNTLSGTVKADILDQGVTLDNLNLKYIIMEKESEYKNAAQVPCKNVVLASGTTPLAGADLQQNVSFNLDYTGTLPSDAYLVIWVQEKPQAFANNATVYFALESHIHK